MLYLETDLVSTIGQTAFRQGVTAKRETFAVEANLSQSDEPLAPGALRFHHPPSRCLLRPSFDGCRVGDVAFTGREPSGPE